MQWGSDLAPQSIPRGAIVEGLVDVSTTTEVASRGLAQLRDAALLLKREPDLGHANPVGNWRVGSCYSNFNMVAWRRWSFRDNGHLLAQLSLKRRPKRTPIRLTRSKILRRTR
jgi:hypothetical protein